MSLTITLSVVEDTTVSVPPFASMKPMAQDDWISGHVLHLFQWLCYSSCILIDIFGTVTNIINIICFVKQGFKEAVNLSLLGLAISDLASLLTNIWTCICVIPAFQEADLPFVTFDVQYVMTGIPHVIFTRITSCITALITLERCLCVTIPLKVKNIMTPKTVTSVIVGILVTLIVSAIPYFAVMRLTTRFYPERNKTMLGLDYTSNKNVVELYFFSVNNFFVPFAAFLVIIISMTILVFKLRQQTLWRKQRVSKEDKLTATERDHKVAKMGVMISLLFVACFIPSGVMFLAMVLVSELKLGGKYEDFLVIVYGIGAFLESANSSMNIFIYYYMSTKYRQVFKQIFGSVQTRLE